MLISQLTNPLIIFFCDKSHRYIRKRNHLFPVTWNSKLATYPIR